MRDRKSLILSKINIVVMALTFLPTGTIQVTNGPGKFDFMNSNFDFKQIEFTCVENGRQFKLEGRITFSGPEDGSKERWVGMASFSNPNKSPGERFSPREERSFYYDSKKRAGVIIEAGKVWKICNS